MVDWGTGNSLSMFSLLQFRLKDSNMAASHYRGAIKYVGVSAHSPYLVLLSEVEQQVLMNTFKCMNL